MRALATHLRFALRTLRRAPGRVLVGRMPLPAMGYTTAETRAIYDRMLERVRALPGVRSASLASHIPFAEWFGAPVALPGVDANTVRRASHHPIGPELNVVSPSFFATTGTVVRSGRPFTDADGAGGESVAIINEKMARTFWPSGNAVGQCISIRRLGMGGGDVPCSRIVGIVEGTKSKRIREEPDLQVYAPLGQRSDVAPGALLVHTDGDPVALAASVRRAMQSAAPGLPFADVRPMAAYLEPEMRPWRLGASMFTLFGAAALALAAVGLYGVFSYAVSRRTREIGIRAALGARSGDILRLVMGDGLRLATVGTAVGIGLALEIGRVLAALLVGVSGTSPTVLGATAAFVLCITMLAVSIPARRAARIDPAVALRDE